MSMFQPLLNPAAFVNSERAAGNPSVLKACVSLAIASFFTAIVSTFAVFPLFSETKFIGSVVPFDMNGAIWNFFLAFIFALLFQLAGFAIARFFLRGKGSFAGHAYFCSTTALAMIPVSAALSIIGLAAGFALRMLAESSTAGEFAAKSWPLFASLSISSALFPAVGFAVKLPLWALDAASAYGSPVFYALLIAPSLSIILLAYAHTRGIAEVHSINWKKALAVFVLSSLILLTLEFVLFKASYVFVSVH